MRKWILLSLILLANPLLAHDGILHLYFYYLKEYAEVNIRDADSKETIEKLFRSRDSNATTEMDPKLLELIDQIEDHFNVRQIEIISGYRSQAFNKQLKETGHHVANESYHTKGMAADIHIDEISEDAVRNYVASLKKGGVGYYPSLNMVHVDVGPVRVWYENTPPKPWVGEKNEKSPLFVLVTPAAMIGTNLNEIVVDSKVAFLLRNKVIVEFFNRDHWEEVHSFLMRDAEGECLSEANFSIHKSLRGIDMTKWLFGKYRLKVSNCDGSDWQFSNEFYYKRM